MCDGRQPEAVGLLVCGIVDEETGHGVYSANLGWRDAPLRDMASQALGLRVGFGHDVGTAGAAELHFGAGVDLGTKIKNSAMLVIGTGIAAALFAAGRPITAGGYAGELGHAAVPGGLDCPCGLHGCLETVGSAAAIANRYAQASRKETPGAREVLAAMYEGDLLVAKIWTEAVDALAYSITQICTVMAPEVIIIGGGLSKPVTTCWCHCARLPQPLIGNPTGAGDSVVAAIAAGLFSGDEHSLAGMSTVR